MKKLLPLLIAAFTAQFLFGQSNVEAKKLLQESSAQMKSYPALSLDFSYTMENNRVDPPIVQKQEGTLDLKGDDYRLKTPQLEQLRTAKTVYTFLHEDEEVQISEYEEEDMGLSPARLLSFYETGYSYKLGGKETIGGKQIKYVILKPNASEEIDKIMIGINASTKDIYSMKQWGTNGTVTTLIVKSLNKNAKWPTNHFTFNKKDFPGYYISE